MKYIHGQSDTKCPPTISEEKALERVLLEIQVLEFLSKGGEITRLDEAGRAV